MSKEYRMLHEYGGRVVELTTTCPITGIKSVERKCFGRGKQLQKEFEEFIKDAKKIENEANKSRSPNSHD